jgi:hypothetical protein
LKCFCLLHNRIDNMLFGPLPFQVTKVTHLHQVSSF